MQVTPDQLAAAIAAVLTIIVPTLIALGKALREANTPRELDDGPSGRSTR